MRSRYIYLVYDNVSTITTFFVYLLPVVTYYINRRDEINKKDQKQKRLFTICLYICLILIEDGLKLNRSLIFCFVE